jgi:hypothetical protein
VEHVDWRAYAATKGLSEKQQKVADKIRKRELRVQHLQREIEKIKVRAGGAGRGRPVLRPRYAYLLLLCLRLRAESCWIQEHPRLCPPSVASTWDLTPCNTCACLQAKEQQMEELSSGQASVLVR